MSFVMESRPNIADKILSKKLWSSLVSISPPINRLAFVGKFTEKRGRKPRIYKPSRASNAVI